MPSFSIPLTGLEADSKALNTIANNLANMNTTAFKSQKAQFSNLFYQQIGSSGSGNPVQIGAGTTVSSTRTDFTQGTISSTGSSTDVAIDGGGFFVLNNNGSNLYTRAGSFSLASNGNLINDSGMSVMGYPANAGVVDTNAPLSPTNIPKGQVQQPKATGSFGFTANLDASAAVNSTFPAQVTLYDSLGTAHNATITYTKTATNTWGYSVAMPDSDFASGTCAAIKGVLNFDSFGNLKTFDPGSGPITVNNSSPVNSSIPVKFTGLADGGADLSMQWNLLGSAGSPSIQQVDQDSAVNSRSQDGYASGQYQDFSINSGGDVEVSFSNGRKLVVGRIALASIPNEQGLQALGNGAFSTTLASGTASVGIPGSGGLGSLQDSALEGSNVNISAEFSNLIIAQRAFQANSKAVTTFDSVTQDTIAMIR